MDAPSQRVAVVTNVRAFAGEPVRAALEADGFAVVCDDPATPEDLVAQALERFGRLDVAVSNDAFPAQRTFLDAATPEDYRTTIEALLVAPFRLVTAAAKHMKAQRSGRIVVISSALPLHPYPGFAMYASARAGANALAQASAKELGPYGISVNAVAANFLASEMYYPKAQWVDDPKYVQRVKDLVPMQRLGRPEEIGALVAFLASGKSDFVTGQVIAFTGGWP